jgi:hypothetical protein
MRARCLLLVAVLPLVNALGCTHNSMTQRAAATAPPPPVPQDRFEAGNPVIVRIVGRTKSLTIAATRLGPVYSVTGPAGQVLLSQGTLDDLRRLHPDLYRHVRSALVSTGAGANAEQDEDSLDYLLIADHR